MAGGLSAPSLPVWSLAFRPPPSCLPGFLVAYGTHRLRYETEGAKTLEAGSTMGADLAELSEEENALETYVRPCLAAVR